MANETEIAGKIADALMKLECPDPMKEAWGYLIASSLLRLQMCIQAYKADMKARGFSTAGLAAGTARGFSLLQQVSEINLELLAPGEVAIIGDIAAMLARGKLTRETLVRIVEQARAQA